MTISDLLAKNAREYPNNIALVETYPDQRLRREITWSQFNDKANKIANFLLNKGVTKGSRVIHLMHNSISWLEIYFGIIRTGAWVVPLNYRFTADDINYCIEIGEANTIIFDPNFIDRINSIKSKLPTKDFYIVDTKKYTDYSNFENEIADSPTAAISIVLNETDDCGLYFTSGTTGMPKPILLTHGNMMAAAYTEQNHHKQTKSDNFILMPPLYHTGGKMHWFGSLLVGGQGTLLQQINPKVILDTVHKEKGTIVFLLVPWAFDILSSLDRGEIKLADYDFSKWRLMHIGAQPVPTSLIKRWKSYFPNMQFDINYGLTESTGPGCVHLGIENTAKINTIGKAGFNWQTRIVNTKGVDVATGEIGELIVKGPGVMKEYYKNPQKTAETIRDGWLYTGDMVKSDDEGFIYIIDRAKDVIISGGENIYPVEIEEALHKHPKIFDVAVIGVADSRLGEVPAAIIQLEPNVELSKEDVASFCEQHLPKYKRPKVIIFDKVPRNPTGKLEKPKLRQKYSTSANDQINN